MSFDVRLGDCREVMATLAADSIDAIVSDPPYGLSFMGAGWDHGVPGVEFWTEALRVAKPGAHLLAFGGTRTYHRLACAIEDAGWEVRDCLMWVYSTGFPKSHNLDGERKGWGTALKPAHEPIIVARKPLTGTVAANVLEHGTGALNVDGCRVGYERPDMAEVISRRSGRSTKGEVFGKNTPGWKGEGNPAGRWPANFIHDGSEEVTQLLGDAARFFYCPKASKADRDEGLDGREEKRHSAMGYERGLGDAGEGMFKDRNSLKRNSHPTVKPTDLMRYLCRLVTPPNGLVLDPFTGSGSTGKAALLEGFRFLGIEREAEYVEIARARCAAAQQPKDLFQ